MSRTITYPPTSSGGSGGGSGFIRTLQPSIPYMTNFSAGPDTAGGLLALAIDVPYDCLLESINWVAGSGSAGNVRCFVYGPATTADQMTGCELVADSGSFAHPSAGTPSEVAFADIPLTAGQYFIGLQFSSTSGSLQMAAADIFVTTELTYMATGVFGTIPDPAPTMTPQAGPIPLLIMRVKPA